MLSKAGAASAFVTGSPRCRDGNQLLGSFSVEPVAGPLVWFVGMLKTAVFPAVIDGLRAIHQMWPAFGSTGVRCHGSSSTSPGLCQSLPAQERNDFSPALLLPRCKSPRMTLATRVAAHSHRPLSGRARCQAHFKSEPLRAGLRKVNLNQ